MSSSWYRIGTVSVTNGSKDIVGSRSLWLHDSAAAQPQEGDIFTTDFSNFYEIMKIHDNQNITLDRAYEGATVAGVSYAIIRNSSATVNQTLANQVMRQFSQKQLMLDELQFWALTTDGLAPITDPTGEQKMVATPASMNNVSASAIDFLQFQISPTGELIATFHGAADSNEFTIDSDGYLVIDI